MADEAPSAETTTHLIMLYTLCTDEAPSAETTTHLIYTVYR